MNVRWMIRRDMPEVLAIEAASFSFPWDEGTFVSELRRGNTVGMVAEADDAVVGYMVYELHRGELLLTNLAVAPGWRRRGVGKAMAGKLVGKLTSLRRRKLTAVVGEWNLGAQLFFRSLGVLGGRHLAAAVRRSRRRWHCV